MSLLETKQQLILAYEAVLQHTSTIQARKDAENVHNISITFILIIFYFSIAKV